MPTKFTFTFISSIEAHANSLACSRIGLYAFTRPFVSPIRPTI